MHRYILVLAAGLLVAGVAYPLTLAVDGRALATVCLPEKPAPAEETAAAELCAYLEKITAATFKTAEPGQAAPGSQIIIGNSKASRTLLGKQLQSLRPDDFIIKVMGQNLVLVGGSPRGTLYAVYSFLEDDLNCRWLTWFGTESVPQLKRLVIGNLNRLEKPAFAVRDMCVQGGVPAARKPDVARFLARNRDQGPDMNFLGDLNGKKQYHKRFGVCVETQNYPDAINHGNFPSCVLKAGEKYCTATKFRFSVRR
jgi:hypothetical protein